MKVKKQCCVFAGEKFSGDEADRLLIILSNEIQKMIELNGVRGFISDMSEEYGLLAAKAVAELKNKYPFVTLECVAPYEGVADYWDDAKRYTYFSVIENCDKFVTAEKKYSDGCFEKQFSLCADNAEYIICPQCVLEDESYKHKISNLKAVCIELRR